jgi:hypothetical protein
MIFNYKSINENLNVCIFIIFVSINLLNIIYYFYSKYNKKKVRFNSCNLKNNKLILNSIKSLKNIDIIIEQPQITYYIKHIDSNDNFYGHFYDIDN